MKALSKALAMIEELPQLESLLLYVLQKTDECLFLGFSSNPRTTKIQEQ